jgi:hypothetical protein
MDNSISKQGSLLTYFGILPFLIFTLAIITGFEQEKAALFPTSVQNQPQKNLDPPIH